MREGRERARGGRGHASRGTPGAPRGTGSESHVNWTRPCTLAALLALSGCQGCVDIDLPPDPPDTDEEQDTDTPPIDSDTGPEPPCAVPEAEPNNGWDEANALPLERRGCGVFESSFDADFWDFELTEQAWMSIDIDAFSLGSSADVSLTLSSEEADVAFGMVYYRDTPDVHVRFPTPPASYQMFIRQVLGLPESLGEGEDFFYEVLVSSSKPPVLHTVLEAPNDTLQTAQTLITAPTLGEPVVLMAGLDSSADEDWYEISIPSGRHRLVVDMAAHELGSGGDFALERFDAAGVKQGLSRRGELGWERDPWYELQTSASQVLYLRVIEEGGGYGLPFWYSLSITLEPE